MRSLSLRAAAGITHAQMDSPDFQAALAKGDAKAVMAIGAGVYSSFVAADTVEFHTKHNDDDCYVWELSSGTKSFRIRQLA